MARPTQQEIEEWERRMSEPEGPDEDDFEIEISTPEGHAARLPYRKGKSYLAQHFGIDVDDLPNGPNAAQGGQQPPANTGGRRSRANASQNAGTVDPNAQILEDETQDNRVSGRYFGGRR